MKRFAGLIFVLFVVVSISRAQQKKRVAVMNFDYSTVHSTVMSIWGADQDIGKGIADLLVDKLVNDGQYSVIERKALDKILGVDAIIIGSITQFGRDDKKTGVGGGAFGGFGRRVGVGGFEKRESKAEVAVTARMINTETAEILASCSGK